MVFQARGMALFESLVALMLFSLLLVISSHALGYLNQWYSQCMMHRLALHRLENLFALMDVQGHVVNQEKLFLQHAQWNEDNQRINSRFSSQIQCRSTRCNVILSWVPHSINQGQTSCSFLSDSCVRLDFSVNHAE